MQLEGYVSNLNENYDKNGRLYYTNELGEVVQPKISPLKTIKNNLDSFGFNAGRWLTETNPESEAYKQKVNTALAIETAPFGIGRAATQMLATKLTPFVGRKIGQMTAQGIGSGLVGGGMEETGRAMIEGEKPLEVARRGLIGAGLGSMFGGALSLGAGQVGKQIARKNLLGNPEAQMNYVGDYLEGLNNDVLTKQGFGLNDIRGLQTGNYGIGEGEKVYNFIGENAQNADRVALNRAQELFNQGIDNESIRQQTGWFKGVDGKWRYEIPYGELYENPELTEWSDIYGRGSKSYSIKLKDLYDASELYNNYPDLADKTIYFDKIPNARGYTDYENIYINQDYLPIINPKYQEELNAIKTTKEFKDFNRSNQQFNNNEISYEDFAPIEEVWNNSPIGEMYNDLLWDSVENTPKYIQKGDEEQLRRTLIHEIQHDIQNKEGFALGATLDDPTRHLSAGEAEARLAAHRSLLRRPGELEEISPLSKGLGGYDLDPEKQIVKFEHNNSNLYDKLTDNEEFDYNKVINDVEKMKAPKPIENELKKGQKFVIMEASEAYKNGEQNYVLNEITTNKNEQFLKDGSITVELPIYNPKKGEKGYFIHTVIKDKDGYKFKKVKSKDETIFD